MTSRPFPPHLLFNYEFFHWVNKNQYTRIQYVSIVLYGCLLKCGWHESDIMFYIFDLLNVIKEANYAFLSD